MNPIALNLVEVARASLQSAVAFNQLSKSDVAEIIERIKTNPEERKLKLLNPQQGKEMFGVSMPTFWKYCKQKNIPKRFVGRQVRFLESDLIKALEMK